MFSCVFVLTFTFPTRSHTKGRGALWADPINLEMLWAGFAWKYFCVSWNVSCTKESENAQPYHLKLLNAAIRRKQKTQPQKRHSQKSASRKFPTATCPPGKWLCRKECRMVTIPKPELEDEIQTFFRVNLSLGPENKAHRNDKLQTSAWLSGLNRFTLCPYCVIIVQKLEHYIQNTLWPTSEVGYPQSQPQRGKWTLQS